MRGRERGREREFVCVRVGGGSCEREREEDGREKIRTYVLLFML